MTMTVTILMEIPLRDDVDDIDDAFLHDLPATRAFPGNELTEVLADATRPHALFMLTRWSSAEAYDQYAAWRSTPEGATRMPDIAAGPPTIHHLTNPPAVRLDRRRTHHVEDLVHHRS